MTIMLSNTRDPKTVVIIKAVTVQMNISLSTTT